MRSDAQRLFVNKQLPGGLLLFGSLSGLGSSLLSLFGSLAISTILRAGVSRQLVVLLPGKLKPGRR